MEAPSKLCFNLEQTFFGFKQSDRVKFHEQIFDLLWVGEGRWTWQDIYHMPIFLRTFYIKKINKLFDEKKKAMEKQRTKQSPKDKIGKPPM